MDYEKLHKDTIAKLQEMVNSGEITVETARGICADFVPESEDERIRKELLSWLKRTDGQTLPIDRYNAAIAWLEKQAQKPNPYSGTSFEYNGHTWGMCARDNGVEILIDGHIKGRVFTNDSNAKEMFIKALERVEELNNKGYKLTDCDKISWWEDFKTYTSYTVEQKSQEEVVDNLHNYLYGEQKPAWSEDDEKMLNKILAVVSLYYGYSGNVLDKQGCTSFLKSLKDRVLPKQEWSEQEKVRVNRIVACLENLNVADNDILLKDIDWLKSIRPQKPIEWTMQDEEELQIALDTLVKAGQHSSAKWLKNVCLVPQSHWKPSEEQMKILNEVLNFAANHESPHWNDYIFGILNNLIRQLKKLREE